MIVGLYRKSGRYSTTLEGAKLFSIVDLFSGYWQVRLQEACKVKRNFVCLFGTFRLVVVPFFLMNATSTFQLMMDQILSGLSFVRVYIDELVVFLKNTNNHYEHFKIVLQCVESSNLKLKMPKCFFVQGQLDLLVNVVD